MQIVSPCRQDFGRMPKKDQGRYCGFCEKVVVDFTKMSNSEITAYIRTSAENVCGRVKGYQLDSPGTFITLLFHVKEKLSAKVSFIPLRMALLAVISGLLAFTTSCMGKMVTNVPGKNHQTGQDTVKKEKPRNPSEPH